MSALRELLQQSILYAIIGVFLVGIASFAVLGILNLIRRSLSHGLVAGVVAILCIVIAVRVGGTKIGNTDNSHSVRRLPRSELRVFPAGEMVAFNTQDSEPVTNLCFRSFNVSGESYVFGVSWPTDYRFFDDWLYIDVKTNFLEETWTGIAAVDVRNLPGIAEVEIPRTRLEACGRIERCFFRLEGEPSPQFSSNDRDADGLPDSQEMMYGLNVFSTDTDGDGISDGDEVAIGTNPLDVDSDGDGVWDGVEIDRNTDPLEDNSCVVETTGPHFLMLGNNTYTDMPLDVTAPGVNPRSLGFGSDWAPSLWFEYYDQDSLPYTRLGSGYTFKALRDGYYTFQIQADDFADIAIGSTHVYSTYPEPGNEVTVFMRANEERDVTLSITNYGGKAGVRILKWGEYSPYRRIFLQSKILGLNSVVDAYAQENPTLYIEKGDSRRSYAPYYLLAGCGDLGGFLTIENQNADRVEKIIGGVLPAPDHFVSAHSRFQAFAGYAGVKQSSEVHDIKWIATFRECFTDYTLIRTSAVTVVEIEDPPAIRTFRFADDAMFYEDPYVNVSDGEEIAKRRQGTSLVVDAYGGENGADLTIEIAEGAAAVSVGVMGWPTYCLHVAPRQTFHQELLFSPESEHDGVLVKAKLTDALSKISRERLAIAPVIKVTLEALYRAPERNAVHRHRLGVGEKVRFVTSPSSVPVSFEAKKGDTTDPVSYYDTFSGAGLVESDKQRIYVCPIAASYQPQASIVYKKSRYTPILQIVEPESIACDRAVASSSENVAWGEVGGAILETWLSIEPKTVSFRGIKVGEIPCNEEDVIEDYFNTPNFRGSRTHSGLAGSWIAKRIDECDNYWTYDLAGRDGPYTGWSAGRLVWKVPIGWFRLVSDSDNYNGHQYWEPESERYGDTSSRPLLIGGTQDAYKQVFQIYEDGSSSVSKFGRWVRRSRWGVLSKNWQ